MCPPVSPGSTTARPRGSEPHWLATCWPSARGPREVLLKHSFPVPGADLGPPPSRPASPNRGHRGGWTRALSPRAAPWPSQGLCCTGHRPVLGATPARHPETLASRSPQRTPPGAPPEDPGRWNARDQAQPRAPRAHGWLGCSGGSRVPESPRLCCELARGAGPAEGPELLSPCPPQLRPVRTSWVGGLRTSRGPCLGAWEAVWTFR